MKKLTTLFIMLAVLGLAMPMAASAQDRDDYRKIIRRDKNGVRIGENRITIFDGPGIVNYEYRQH